MRGKGADRGVGGHRDPVARNSSAGGVKHMWLHCPLSCAATRLSRPKETTREGRRRRRTRRRTRRTRREEVEKEEEQGDEEVTWSSAVNITTEASTYQELR